MWGRGRSRRAPRPRAGRLHRRRGRARPVLLPPSGRVPRSVRSRPRSSTTRARRSTPSTCCAPRTRRRSSHDDAEFFGPRWAAARRGPAERRRASPPRAPRPDVRARARRRTTRRRRVAALGLARPLRHRRRAPPVSCSARSRPRAPTRPCTRARSTCTWAAPTRSPSSTSTAAARSSRRSPATGTRSPSARRDTDIVRLLDRREALGVTLSFGEVSVTETVLAYQRKGVSDHACVELIALDLPPVSFPTQALWFELDARAAGSRRSRCEDAARRAARDRARADRRAAADRDVRPLGHRRAVDQLPPADRHARRSSSTTATPAESASRAPRFERFEELCRDAHAADRRVPVRRTAAPRACSRPSAATSTSRCTRPERARCFSECSPPAGYKRPDRSPRSASMRAAPNATRRC